MRRVETLTDVPDDVVDEVVQDFRDAGANPVTKTKQANGLWTVVAVFADQTLRAIRSLLTARVEAAGKRRSSKKTSKRSSKRSKKTTRKTTRRTGRRRKRTN